VPRTIFYSWQSDLPGSICRNFIEDALERAARNVGKAPDVLIEPVVDRDTAGVSGSPSIPDTILAKIAAADMFVADVSIITKDGARRAPNPNVLLELGFAVATLGWDRILLVQNIAFGGPEDLPFDLKGRRVATYNLPDATTQRSEVRRTLVARCETAITSAITLTGYSDVHASRETPLWWGKWTMVSRGHMHAGHLFIQEVGPASFLFEMEVINGSHSGRVSGVARIISTALAYCQLKGGKPWGPCEISFRRSIKNGQREIEVEESVGCHYFHGMGASFTGKYVHCHEPLFDGEILDELDLQRLYGITGEFFEPLINCFQGLSEIDLKDSFVASARVGGVRGLYGILEGIIIRGELGQLWAAYIDGDIVRYFTTQREYKTKLPETIENWRQRFQEKEVVFDSGIDVIPHSYLPLKRIRFKLLRSIKTIRRLLRKRSN
jgi:hypothetical protein